MPIFALRRGKRFGRWKVIGPGGTIRSVVMALCKCDCGVMKEVYPYHLIDGKSTGCARCKSPDQFLSVITKHGGAGTPLYEKWKSIKARCYNPNNRQWGNYGGRGIAMTEGWRENFPLFRDWVMSNLGERPVNCTLDRIDNEGDYAPGNIRWATHAQQSRNTRHTRWITHPLSGERMCLADWADHLGIRSGTLSMRIKFMPLERALSDLSHVTTPKTHRSRPRR